MRVGAAGGQRRERERADVEEDAVDGDRRALHSIDAVARRARAPPAGRTAPRRRARRRRRRRSSRRRARARASARSRRARRRRRARRDRCSMPRRRRRRRRDAERSDEHDERREALESERNRGPCRASARGWRLSGRSSAGSATAAAAWRTTAAATARRTGGLGGGTATRCAGCSPGVRIEPALIASSTRLRPWSFAR